MSRSDKGRVDYLREFQERPNFGVTGMIKTDLIN